MLRHSAAAWQEEGAADHSERKGKYRPLSAHLQFLKRIILRRMRLLLIGLPTWLPKFSARSGHEWRGVALVMDGCRHEAAQPKKGELRWGRRVGEIEVITSESAGTELSDCADTILRARRR
jgi:hypothetical protein